MLERVWRKGNPCRLLVGMYIGAATMENSREGPLKTKHRATIWSSNPTPGFIFGKDKNSNSKRYMHPTVHSSTMYSSQTWKQPKCLLRDEWIKKMWHIYIYIYIYILNGLLLSHKKEWNNAICSNRDRPREISKSDRERQISYVITYMWNLKNDTNELTKQKQTQKTNLQLPKRKGKEG